MTSPIAMGVCSGNVQRSPTYEAVIKYELAEEGYSPADLRIESAGINVEKILANKAPSHKMVNILRAGLKYGLVRPEIKDDVELLVRKYQGSSESVDEQEKARIASFYSEVRPAVHGALATYRNIALEQAGVPKEHVPTEIYVPFEQKEGLGIVLAMDEGVLTKLKERIGNDKTPLTTYGELVGRAPLEDDLTSGLEGAVRQVEYFMDTRQKAVNEIFKRT
jgi:hypothetical protein